MKSRANASNIKIRDRRKLIEGGLGSSSHNMPSHNIPGGKGGQQGQRKDSVLHKNFYDAFQDDFDDDDLK